MGTARGVACFGQAEKARHALVPRARRSPSCAKGRPRNGAEYSQQRGTLLASYRQVKSIFSLSQTRSDRGSCVNTARPELAGLLGKHYSCQPKVAECLDQQEMSIEYGKNHRACNKNSQLCYLKIEASPELPWWEHEWRASAPSLAACARRSRRIPPTLPASRQRPPAFLPSPSKVAHLPAPSAKPRWFLFKSARLPTLPRWFEVTARRWRPTPYRSDLKSV